MTRDPLDRYYTPYDVALSCMEAVAEDYRWLRSDTEYPWVLEPSVGRGGFARAIRATMPHSPIYGIDIDPIAGGFEYCEESEVVDFLEFRTEIRFDAVLGNPPFRHALAHVRHAISMNGVKIVGLLLRLGFMASQKRFEFFQENPPHRVFVLSERPSFTGDGKTDGADYGFYVWIPGSKATTQLEWI